ncbi:MAG: ATP-binding protein [Methanoregulaceae archaeon]|nr:ATP-binding protein [Methanoregulaceae archaeon]
MKKKEELVQGMMTIPCDPSRASPIRIGWFTLFLIILLVTVSPAFIPGGEGSKNIVLMIHDDLPPYEYIDAEGLPAGFARDVLEAVARDKGLNLTVAGIPPGTGLPDIPEDASLVTPVFVEMNASDSLSNHVPLIPVEYVIVRKSHNIADYLLKPDPSLIIPRTGAMETLSRYLPPGSRFRSADTTTDALVQLELGFGDGAIVDRVQGEYLIQNAGFHNLSLTRELARTGSYDLAVTMPDGTPDAITAALLSDGIFSLRESGEYSENTGTLGSLPRTGDSAPLSPLFFYLFTPFALIILTAFSWSWALRRQVAKKTAELQEELSERKRTEEELRKAKNYLNNIIDSIAEPVFVKDRQHRWVILNDAVCRMIGHPREELLGRTDYEFFPASEADIFREKDEEVFRTGNENINEEYLTDASGNRHIILTKKTLYTDTSGDAYIIGVISDITRQKHFEDNLKHFNEELEQRVRDRTLALEQSNRELESFSYTVSHDLRAPLRAIDGYSSILIDEAGKNLGESERRLLEQIRKNSRQMAALIDDLTNFARMARQGLNRTMVSPADIVQDVLEELRDERTGRDIEITTSDLPICFADPVLLHRVYYNLLSNALKFSRSRSKTIIEIGSLQKHGQTVYFVKDNGIGFDMKYIDKIFKVFERLCDPSRYEGTGVGLAIVQRIIARHGGSVWAEAEPDKGATFYFTLGGGMTGSTLI